MRTYFQGSLDSNFARCLDNRTYHEDITDCQSCVRKSHLPCPRHRQWSSR